MRLTGFLLIVCCLLPQAAPDTGRAAVARFAFDGNVDNSAATRFEGALGGAASYVEGLEGEALRLSSGGPGALFHVDRGGLPFARNQSFSVQFWVRTIAKPERRMVLVSQKAFADNSLASQKSAGWVFYASGGTWAWNMGSGSRRITYERDNGTHMPLNDGRWHQLTMTYDSAFAEIRLFYDGINRAAYNVDDAVGFDFGSEAPLVVGSAVTTASPAAEVVPAIGAGADTLQELVDEFNRLGLPAVEAEEFVHLIVDPEQLFERKLEAASALRGADRAAFRESMRAPDFARIAEIESALMRNPYTVHQALSFMEVAPLMQIYSLAGGVVNVDEDAARRFTEKERLYPPDFDIDDLAIWDRALSADEVLASYGSHFRPLLVALDERVTTIRTGAWNIFHGGKHFTIDEHGWDSRRAIAEILRREAVDVVMMQETYSSGDFIAAELGYFFATTVDRDYLNQGANISVLSRYPIEELHVEGDSPFMNVGVKLAISETQDLYAMSNWYGMQQFPAVFDFHQPRFARSDDIPTVFGGDFNAVPHTDGGDSLAARTLLDAGFTDAFRSLHPDVQQFPGHTHRSGRRIDQLYYRGVGLTNTSTRLVNEWPTGFPSDHYLIVSTFELDYATSTVAR